MNAKAVTFASRLMAIERTIMQDHTIQGLLKTGWQISGTIRQDGKIVVCFRQETPTRLMLTSLTVSNEDTHD